MSVSTTRHVVVLGESNCGKVSRRHHFVPVVYRAVCLTLLQSELVRKLCGAPFLGESSPTLGIASQVKSMHSQRGSSVFIPSTQCLCRNV